MLDNQTLETVTKAKQLDTDLSELSVLIEGKLAFRSLSFFVLLSLFLRNININDCTCTVVKCIK